MSFADAVAEIAEAAGRDIRYVPIPSDAFKAGLAAAGMPAEHVELLAYLFATVLDGRNAFVADGVERALGRPAHDFRDYARATAARGVWTPLTTQA